jgi:hypothetical protein
VFGLITTNLVSYYDLKYRLTVEDVLDLIEIMIVNESNKNIVYENNKGE